MLFIGILKQFRINQMANELKPCKGCGVMTSNSIFCSRSCATKVNNTLNPKRKRQNKCKNCDTLVTSNLKYCKDCNNQLERLKDITLQEAADSYSKHHRSNAFSLVRSRARSVAKRLGYTTCEKCGYDKHVEIAHIKAISSFDLSTLISVINSPENLIALCPNCHWEHDHSPT